MIDRRNVNEILVSRIRRLRREHPDGRERAQPFTQQDLADLSCVSRTTVANVEGGKQLISVELLYRFCQALGVEPVEVMPSVGEVSQLDADELLSIERRATQVTVDGKHHVLPAEWANAVRETTGE
jgi:transcriptional regulator with XRE-family HTH domain